MQGSSSQAGQCPAVGAPPEGVPGANVAGNVSQFAWDPATLSATMLPMVGQAAPQQAEPSGGGGWEQHIGHLGPAAASSAAAAAQGSTPMWPGQQSAHPGGSKAAPTCQVCSTDVSHLKDYYQRYRICPYHCTLSAIIKDGLHLRFCQQCGKFEPLEAFDGEKRTCRRKLERHNARRRKGPAPAKKGGVGAAPPAAKKSHREKHTAGQTMAPADGGAPAALSPTGPPQFAMPDAEALPLDVAAALAAAMSAVGMDLDDLPPLNGPPTPIDQLPLPGTGLYFPAQPQGAPLLPGLAPPPRQQQQHQQKQQLQGQPRLNFDSLVADLFGASSSGIGSAALADTLLGSPRLQPPGAPRQHELPDPTQALVDAAEAAMAVAERQQGLEQPSLLGPPSMEQAQGPQQQRQAAVVVVQAGGPSVKVQHQQPSVRVEATAATQAAAWGPPPAQPLAASQAMPPLNSWAGAMPPPPPPPPQQQQQQQPGSAPASLQQALEMMQGHNQLRQQHQAQDRLVRLSLKFFGCNPDVLPLELKQELEVLLGSPVLEGYLRPGCVHVTLDALLEEPHLAALQRRGAAAAVEALLTRGNLGGLVQQPMFFQLYKELVVVMGGKVVCVLKLPACEGVLPCINSITPCCINSSAPGDLAARGTPVLLRGLNLFGDQRSLLVRLSGRYPLVEVMAKGTKDATPLGTRLFSQPEDWLQFRIPGAQEGCYTVEVQRGALLGPSRVLLALQDEAAVAEVRQLELDTTGVTDVQAFLQSLGLLLRWCQSSALAGCPAPPAAEVLGGSAARATQCALAVCAVRGWSAVARMVLPALAADGSTPAQAMALVDQLCPPGGLLLTAVAAGSAPLIQTLAGWGAQHGYSWAVAAPTGPSLLTPLHLVALKRDPDLLRALFAMDPDAAKAAWFTARTADGCTPADFAEVARQQAQSSSSSISSTSSEGDAAAIAADAGARNMHPAGCKCPAGACLCSHPSAPAAGSVDTTAPCLLRPAPPSLAPTKSSGLAAACTAPSSSAACALQDNGFTPGSAAAAVLQEPLAVDPTAAKCQLRLVASAQMEGRASGSSGGYLSARSSLESYRSARTSLESSKGWALGAGGGSDDLEECTWVEEGEEELVARLRLSLSAPALAAADELLLQLAGRPPSLGPAGEGRAQRHASLVHRLLDLLLPGA